MEDKHSPEHSKLLAENKRLKMFLAELKREHMELLNETTAQSGTERTEFRKVSFNLTEQERDFLGSMDPTNKGILVNGLRFIISFMVDYYKGLEGEQ